MAPTFIPRHLLPLYHKGYDAEWADNTYQYCHLFNNQVSDLQPVDQNAVLDWMSLGQRLQMELKDDGIRMAEEQVLAIASTYGMTMADNQVPTSLSDVIQIIANKTWYRPSEDLTRGIIYLIAYGIFRDGHNKWANNAAVEWLRSRNLQYMAPTKAKGKDSRHGKGFVYSLLVQRASDRISKLVQNTMRHAHREFLAVKNRDLDDTAVYGPCRYGAYHFYLATVIDTSPKEALTTFRASVQRAVKLKIPANQLLHIVHHEYTPNMLTPDQLPSPGKRVLFNVAILHPIYIYAS